MIALASVSLADLATQASERLKADLAVLGGEPPPEILVQGDGRTQILALSSAEEASPGALCFVTSPAFLAKAQAGRAAAVVAPPSLAQSLGDWPALVTVEPRLAFAAILGLAQEALRPPFPAGEPFFRDRPSCQIGPNVILGPQSYIGARVKIGANSVVGPGVFLEDDVEIGQNTILHPRAILRWGVKVGDRCQIHAGAVIGEDGFGYTQVPSPKTGRLIHYKNPHLGRVVIGDDVEIGALSAVDRGLVADTVIERGTKMDNLAQIGHNCHLGQDVIVVAQVGCAGHSQVGDRVFLLGQCGLTHGAVVGQDAIITGQSGVTGQVPAGRQPWSGTPVRPQSQTLRTQAMVLNDLPRWRRFWSVFKKSPTYEALKKTLSETEV
ncbi:MAG: UDP-3-O-(3-hydroxymyristoyl)glucosamine N-acyltransferase [Deltaproteobacteria bacterium]|jgi:UDP-3-O-[3-hydroxymyristoyl] glucosamine N-acyltransferase|nr:UDP-3-O-(3-hydroxymyristoyl)glucosamine N-acyltransferase [Deltaproteobacteria bacterium]